MFVRLITLVLGMLMTRILSGHFSLQEYGTYSQVLLMTTTISSMTILGMMDGINFFFCKETEVEKRDAYISTIFCLQYIIGIIVSLIVLACTVPIAQYFNNDELKSLIIFVAALPILNNSISLLQIMFIAIGEAKVIAIRNLIVSITKLLFIALACYVFNDIVVILFFQLLSDALQITYFFILLTKRNCKINIARFDKSLVMEILRYCIPMAMFGVIKSLNRDSDKFVISFFTNTETLAVYTNASKILPFDIIMTSFCTVLLPYITRFISCKNYKKTQQIYKSFLELSYISTTILASGAICVASELLRFLYSEKYATYSFSIIVFIIYTMVDILSILNITLVLSAAGKTKTIFLASIGTFFANILLNIMFYFSMGEIGPAFATFIVTLVQGVIMLRLSAKEMEASVSGLFSIKYLICFAFQTGICFVLISLLRNFMVAHGIYYFITMMVCFASYTGVLLLGNIKRLLYDLREINIITN